MKRKDNNWVLNLLEDINIWLTDCVYISSYQLKGKFTLSDTRIKLVGVCNDWMQEIDQSRVTSDYGIRKTANEIVEILDTDMEKFFKDKISTNFYFVSLRMHQNQIEEKMYSYLRS